MRESGHRWLAAAQHSSATGISETTAELQSLLRAEDWQSLASLPAEAFMRRLEDRMSDAKSASDIAIKNQQAFASGLQQALEAWQNLWPRPCVQTARPICPLCHCRTSSSNGCLPGRRPLRTPLRPRAASSSEVGNRLAQLQPKMATLPPAGRLVSWLSIAKIRCFRRFVVTHKTLDAIVFESS
jgi:hypothetical protein